MGLQVVLVEFWEEASLVPPRSLSPKEAYVCFPTIAGKWWQVPLAQSAPRNPGKHWHSPDTHSPFPWQLRGQSCTESEKERNSATTFSSVCCWSNFIMDHPPFLQSSGSKPPKPQGAGRSMSEPREWEVKGTRATWRTRGSNHRSLFDPRAGMQGQYWCHFCFFKRNNLFGFKIWNFSCPKVDKFKTSWMLAPPR